MLQELRQRLQLVCRQARDKEDAQRLAISKAKQRASAELAKKAETSRLLRRQPGRA
jgi:hypothetical protein